MSQNTENYPSVTVIIPCRNESFSIGKVIQEIRELDTTFQILVVDNNSTDGTADIALALGARLLIENRVGKGFAVRKAFDSILTNYVVLIDGDGTYDVGSIPNMLSKLDAGADMVVATRTAIDVDAFPSLHKFGNRVFSMLHRSLFQSEVSDSFSGFRALNMAFTKSFYSEAKGFEIETDLNIHAKLIGASVQNVISPYKKRVEGSRSKLSTFKDGSKLLFYAIKLGLLWNPIKLLMPLCVSLFLSGTLLVVPPVLEFFNNRFVYRVPSLVAGLVLIQLSFILMTFSVHFARLARVERSVLSTQFRIMKSQDFTPDKSA